MAEFTTDVLICGAGGDIADVGGHIRAGYGVSPGDWVLIRPDGYIGAMVCSGETPALSQYLDEVGLRTFTPAQAAVG